MRTARIVGAVVLGLGVLAVAAVAADNPGPGRVVKVLSWAAAEGKPTFEPGKAVGAYIWHEGDQVQLVLTAEKDKEVELTGSIILRAGTIEDLTRLNGEPGDTVKQTNASRLSFKLTVRGGSDGFKFKVKDEDGKAGRHIIAFEVKQAGEPVKVCYGAKATEVASQPVVFDRLAGN